MRAEQPSESSTTPHLSAHLASGLGQLEKSDDCYERLKVKIKNPKDEDALLQNYIPTIIRKVLNNEK